MQFAILVEQVGNHTIRAICPLLGMDAEGPTREEAIRRLRVSIEKRAKGFVGWNPHSIDVPSLSSTHLLPQGNADEVLFLIPTNLSRPFFVRILQECESEFERVFGDSLRTILRYVPRDDEEFRTEEVTRLLWREFRASQRIRLVVVAPTESRRLTREVARTIGQVDKTIPVIALTLPFRGVEAFREFGVSHPACLVCHSERGTQELGKAAAREFGQRRKSANVVLIRGARGRADSYSRVRGFKEGLKSAGVKHRLLKLEPRFCDWKRDQAGKAFHDLVAKWQTRIDIVFAANDEMALGVRETILKSADATSRQWMEECRIYGFDAIPEMLSLVNCGDRHVRGTVEQPSKEMANQLAYMVQNVRRANANQWAAENGGLRSVFVDPILHFAPKAVQRARSELPPPPYDGSDQWQLTSAVPKEFGSRLTLKKYAQTARRDTDEHGEYGIHGKRTIRKLRIIDGKIYWWLGETTNGP